MNAFNNIDGNSYVQISTLTMDQLNKAYLEKVKLEVLYIVNYYGKKFIRFVLNSMVWGLPG